MSAIPPQAPSSATLDAASGAAEMSGVGSARGTTVLATRGVSKAFAGVRVLEGVSFDVRAGEVHTLMGENGAGKSTLMKILAGVHRPDAGQLLLDGREVAIASPVAAGRLGIALIHQEPLSFPELTVAENVLLSRPPGQTARGPLGQIAWRDVRRQARTQLEALGVPLDVDAPMAGLPIADQQMVELAAALAQDARVLLMDEPTAALTPREVDRLFNIVRKLRDAGKAIVFISHRLPEVFEISDRITVLRDGHFVATHVASDTTPAQIIREMVGRDLGEMYERAGNVPGDTVLEVRGLTVPGVFSDVGLTVRAGEVVGLAGLVGAGRTEVAEAIFGIRRASAGTVRVGGREVRAKDPRQAMQHGIAYVPEDRARHGLFLPMSVRHNATAATLDRVSTLGWLRGSSETAVAERWRRELSTRLRDVAQPVRELSGGNQQKVVLGKWLEGDPRVLILDEPTRGVDVGAKAEIHHRIAELARQGRAVLMISSDLPEVLAMSDRVLVMREGRVAGELSSEDATQEAVMRLATGQATSGSGTGILPADRPEKPDASHSERVHGQDARATQNTTSPHAQAAPAGNSLLRRTLFSRETSVAAFVAVGFGVAAALEPRMLSADVLRSVLLYIPLIVVVAMGQMMAIVSRNIDLSVGSTLALAAIIVGNLYITHPGMPLGVALLVAATVGGLAGLVNGTLIAWLRIPAIIATLGTMTAYRGLVFVYSGGKQVDGNNLPPQLIALSQSSPLGIPWLVLFAGAVAVVTAVWLGWSRTGREIFAIGSNPHAAALRGIPVARTLALVYTLTGALAGVAGLMFASRFGYVNPGSTGQGFELMVISAVVIGGVNVFGGAGTVLGVVLGSVLLGLVGVALPVVGVSAFWQLAVYGLAILVAAGADSTLRRFGTRRGRAA